MAHPSMPKTSCYMLMKMQMFASLKAINQEKHKMKKIIAPEREFSLHTFLRIGGCCQLNINSCFHDKAWLIYQPWSGKKPAQKPSLLCQPLKLFFIDNAKHFPHQRDPDWLLIFIHKNNQGTQREKKLRQRVTLHLHVHHDHFKHQVQRCWKVRLNLAEKKSDAPYSLSKKYVQKKENLY